MFNRIRLFFAIITAKILTNILRMIGKGATALPGLVALKISPNLIKELTAQLEQGLVIISGTNGKTTTARILATILSVQKINFIHNRAGSNLLRGIASTLTQHISLTGRFKAKIAIFECDEATLPLLIKETYPRLVVLTNLFRDQLDRYGEITTIAKMWLDSLKKLPATSSILLNADDPTIAHFGDSLGLKVYYFGINDNLNSQNSLDRFADSKYCSYCTTPLEYELVFISHLGKYFCKNCGKKRPNLHFSASDIKLNGLKGSNFSLKLMNKETQISFNLPGLYNIYNAISAAGSAAILNIKVSKIKEALEKSKAVFGRTEELKIDNHNTLLFLVKNPTGFNEAIRTLFSDNQQKSLIIAINDLLADGRDVSWLWDVDFEKMVGKTKTIIATGLRAYDLGLRLKYAGIDNINIKQNIDEALTDATIKIPESETLYILPTYTAMLEIRRKLAKFNKTGHFWED